MNDMNMGRCMVGGKTRTGQPDYPVVKVLGISGTSDYPIFMGLGLSDTSDSKTTKEEKLQSCHQY